MTKFSVAVEIKAGPKRVWAVMKDVERWHEWTASIESITPLDGRTLAVGNRYRILQPKALPAVWRVTELEEGRNFIWECRAPGVVVTGYHRVEAAGSGSRATLGVHYQGLLGSLAAWLTRNLNDPYLNLEAAGLKHRSEAVN